MKGHIRRRGKGTWSIVLDIGADARGKRRQKWQTVRGTKRAAQKELNRLLHELDSGTYVEPSNLSLAQYLERWLLDYAKQNVSAKTFERYEEIVTRHLAPALGHHPLDRLKPLHIQGYYAVALQEGRRDGKGGLSPQTVLHHHRLLNQALKQALRWQLLARNPAEAVEPPRVRPVEMQTLDHSATIVLLQAAAGTRLHLPLLIAVGTGLRRGEILALRWSDLDLEAGMLSVRQTLELTRQRVGFKEPKTPRSRRRVALPALLVKALREHWRHQAEERLLFGSAYRDHNLVCPAVDGAPWNPRNFTKAFAKLVARTNIPRIRFHDLRHTHASHLLSQGIHPKVVSERLGHATVAITLDRYSHVLPGLQEDAARKIDGMLRGALAAARSTKT